jgi:hypothetical protein
MAIKSSRLSRKMVRKNQRKGDLHQKTKTHAMRRKNKETRADAEGSKRF